MRGFRWLGWIAVGIVALSGCATRNSVLGQAGELKPEAGSGYVAATLVSRVDSADPSLNLVGFPSIYAMFYAEGVTDKSAFDINTATDLNNTGLWGVPGATLDEPRGRRVMSLVAVPAGRYRLGRVYSKFIAYNKELSLDINDPPVIEVRPGQVTYVGSIQLINQVGKTIFGQARPSKASLRVVDEADRDIAAMQRTDARLARLTIVDGLQNQGGRLTHLSKASQDEAAAPTAPAAPTAAMASGPRKWDGWMACSARPDAGANADAFNARWTVDIDGATASGRRDAGEVTESLLGEVRDGKFTLQGKGQRNGDAARGWQYHFSGDLAPGAANVVVKGTMNAGGRAIRSCELRLQRV